MYLYIHTFRNGMEYISLLISVKDLELLGDGEREHRIDIKGKASYTGLLYQK